jgi:ATP-dependent helicase HepA
LIRKYLDALAGQLCAVLREALPSLDKDWWERHVISRLTFQQQGFVRTSKITSLEGLDIAALLRVLDQNWHEIAATHLFPVGSRTWLKEAQTIRNRWAHAPSSGLDAQDTYRDLDTLSRLLTALGAEQGVLNEVASEKKAVLVVLSDQPTSTEQHSQVVIRTEGAYSRGSIVRLKAQPATKGAIIDHLAGEPEDRYAVFHDGATSTYYASQLELAELPGVGTKSVTLHELNAALTALQILHPSIAHLYSLYAARINFVPYQFRPVLKLIQADRPRLLIADEVGVGKTIEAGLILKELQARSELRSVLVICPKPLVAERKWMEELKRFDEQFVHLDGDALRYCIDECHLDGVWPRQYARAIVPYSLFDEALICGRQRDGRSQRGLLDLDPPPAFDLVIVDEAHHIRNTETWAYRTVRYFCDNAEAAVLLSATPIQLSDNDLFTLLHLLRPDAIPGRREFDRMAEPNPFINQAIELARSARGDWRSDARGNLERALATPWGASVLSSSPSMQSVFDAIDETNLTSDRRLALVRDLEELYSFSTYINRTRRRDIGSFTTRKPDTVEVEFTAQQRRLHDGLLTLIARIMERRHGNVNLQFLLTTVRRQAASCIFGLAPLLEAILKRQLSVLEASEAGGELNQEEIGDELSDFRGDIQELMRQAGNMPDEDPKLEALRRVIRDKQRLPSNKLLLFSSFRHTLRYLVERLEDLGVRAALIHGDVPEEARRVLRNRFSLPREDPEAVDLLLSSEVGCEGLDYQFCDGLVNYDLPWNPMRVEQRIGRIDRYGQRSETVAIYNFVTPGTVDADIYQRCLLRIGVFRQALGGSEEILGRLTRDLRDIAENLTLTPEERGVRLQQLADNEVRAVQEQARVEEEQNKFFGISAPVKAFDEMVRDASSYWLKPPMVVNLVASYLENLPGVEGVPGIREKKIVTLRLPREAREALLGDFTALDLGGVTANSWSRWLRGTDSTLAITFEPATADDRRDLTFVTPMHPLARQAARACSPTGPLGTVVNAASPDLEPGRYPYAIYRWKKLGLKEDFTFQPICCNAAVADHLLELLENGAPGLGEGPTLNEQKDLEARHYATWSDARATHVEQVAQVAGARLASLRSTNQARIALLQEQLDQVAEDRIRRMRESQIGTARLDFERRAATLSDAASRADIVAEPVAFGVIAVSRGNPIG